MTICLIIFALMVIGFFIKQLPMSFTSMAVLVALVLTGCVEAKTALGAFGNSTVVTMVSMFIVAAGLSRTQMINHLSKLLLKVTGGSFTKVLASYVVVTCILGQFIPSIVALFALVCPLKKQEPLSPVREFLGYGIFVAVIVCLMLGFSSWKVTLIGAIAVVFSGVLTEREAIDNMNMSTVLLYVGVTVLGEGLSQTGAAEMLGNWIANVLSGVSNGYVIGAAFYIVAYIMTSLLYNRAVTTVLVPLTVITCGSMGCDPRGPIILCALASMSSLITPLSTAVVPMAMNAGGYSAKTVFKAGLIPGILRGALGVLIAMTLFPAFG